MAKVKLNQNTLAKMVAEKEGLKTSVNIAQVKEVIKWTFVELITMAKQGGVEMSEIISLMEKTHKKYGQ